MTAEAEDVVDRVVVEASDPRRACAGSFGFEIEHLADDPGFPVQVSIEGRPELLETAIEIGEHSQAEEAVACNLLVAAHTRGEAPAVTPGETIERQ